MIPQINNSVDAIAFGQKATADQFIELTSAHRRALGNAFQINASLNFNKWRDAMFQLQFIGEAIEAYKQRQDERRKTRIPKKQGSILPGAIREKESDVELDEAAAKILEDKKKTEKLKKELVANHV